MPRAWAVAGLEVRRTGAAWSRVGSGPIPAESWQVGTAPTTAASPPTGFARRAAGHPAALGPARMVVLALPRSASRLTRPISTVSRAAVVSPINPQYATHAPAFTQAKAEPPCRHSATGQARSKSSGPVYRRPHRWPAYRRPAHCRPAHRVTPIVSAPHLNRVRKRCRTISYTISVVTVFTEPVKRSMPGARGAMLCTGLSDLGLMVPRNGA
jgi:hypothetical protein